MKKFRFDSLLKIRENVRDEKKIALELSLNLQNELQRKINAQKMTIEQHIKLWKLEQKGTVLPELLIQFRNHQEYLASVLAKLQSEMNALNSDIENKRNELNEANQDVKVLENLKEKIAERNQEEAKQQEQKELDEIAQRLNHQTAATQEFNRS